MIPSPAVDGRRVESFFQELRRFAPNYTPDLNLSDEQGAGVALMRIFAQLAEIVAVRLDQAPQKHFVAFLDKLGITLLPSRAARAAVTFRLAAGLEEEVRVPSGTRVTAPGKEDEIPFETTGELVAIPGKLTATYGVDPLKDLIFGPPPNFLKQEPRTPTELSYEIQSFVSADSNRLQLNHTTELEPGSFIRIGCKEKTVVQKVDEGNFVTLYEPVKENFTEGTVVVPIRNFEVFNGIDRQEHILYIAHANLFTIKEEVEITLEIELSNSEESNRPLNLAWEFWTKDENVTPEEDEHWHPLRLKSEGTGGLLSSGRIVLVKDKDLEVKPLKVGRVESRWIRARLEDKLPVGSSILPEIETIKISVSTKVDANGDPIGIFADQGFYNATPLDVQVDAGIGFFPFGTEPRQFDQFYVASKEAFSKREAEVNLHFDLDLQTLAGPAVVRTNAGLRVYSIGLRHRLYELDLASGKWINLNSPFDVPISTRPQGSRYFPVEDSIPAAITTAAGDAIFVFVKTEDTLDSEVNNRANKLWGHFHLSTGPNTNPFWFDLDAPDASGGKKFIRFNPAAVALPPGWPAFIFATVFVVGSDRKLHFNSINSAGVSLGGWFHHVVGEPTCNSSPYVVTAGSDIFAYVTGDDGVVYRLDLTLASTVWTPLTPISATFKAASRPFALSMGGANAKVFVVGTDGGTERRLFECDTSAPVGGRFRWVDLGSPPSGIPEGDPAPEGYVEDIGENDLDQEGKHIFLRGTDNQLWERLDGLTSGGQPRWESRTRAGDPNLRDSPAISVEGLTSQPTIHVFAASDRNSVVAWEFEIHRNSSISNAHRRAVLLDEDLASSVDNEYRGDDLTIEHSDGTSETRNIISYDGAERLARVSPALTDLPESGDTCFVDGDDLGEARPETDQLLALHDPKLSTRRAAGLAVRIDGDFAVLDFYSRLTGVASLESTLPTSSFDYSVYARLESQRTEFLSIEDSGTVPELSWEYWNGRGWLSLTVIDGTRNLLSSGTVTISRLPKDIEATEVAGQENFWIRARLVGGDYGRETFRIEGNPPNQRIVSEKSSLRPPKVQRLLVSYKANPGFPETCLTFNNLDYLDQTAACETAGSHFPPFETLEDTSFTIFFGFDKSFKSGPVRLLLDAAERNYDETRPPEFAWSFRKDRKWKQLDAEDGSVALTRQGVLTVSASDELTRESRFGESLYWIKGSLRLDRALAGVEDEIVETKGPCGDPGAGLKPADSKNCTCTNCKGESKCSCHSSTQPEDPCALFSGATKASQAVAAASADYPLPLLRGIFLNTVWAIHGETITEEIIGSGDGEQNQTHALQQDDVLQGEDIRVQEALSAEERERIEREFGKDSVADREDLGGTWVRWKEVKALFDCGPDDRCYEIDRAAGILRFGDGEHGRIVPAGVDNIRAFSYRTGGGLVGNVDTNKIEALATAVAGIESVFNPVPAGGGSDKADTNAMLTIGPRRISHGDRAVSVEDFEELAYEASRQIAKVRCLSTTNLVRTSTGLPDPCDPRQFHQALKEHGWVSLVIVPDLPDPHPCPSLELRRAVKDYLSERAPSVVAAGNRIVVRPPDYVTVGVEAKIFVTTLEKAAAVETEARTKLEKFLHPVRGGPEGNGWEFGRPVTRSDIFGLLERIPDIDRVEELVFQFGARRDANRVEIGPNELLASGEHRLAIKKA